MNESKNTSSKKQGKSSASNDVSNYRHNPKVETPDPKAATNKRPSSGNIKGV
jgi:hypothetical protein